MRLCLARTKARMSASVCPSPVRGMDELLGVALAWDGVVWRVLALLCVKESALVYPLVSTLLLL